MQGLTLHRGGEAEQCLILLLRNPARLTVFFLVVDIAHWGLQLVPGQNHAEQEPLETEGQGTEPEHQGVLAVTSSPTLLTVKCIAGLQGGTLAQFSPRFLTW